MRKHLLFTFLISASLSQAQVSLVKDINPVGDGLAFYSNNRIEFNGKLIFAANDGTNGMELWESDGTESGTQILHTTNSLSASGNPREFFKFNGLLYFSAAGTNIGDELYSTDGTPSGRTSYPEMAIFSDSSPRKFFNFNNNIFFVTFIRDFSLFRYGRELMSFEIGEEGFIGGKNSRLV